MISRRGAAEAALAVIDEHGLDGFNMALVASRLGVKPPSLYHHFRDRREVLAEVALLLLDPGTIDLHETEWAERLIELCLKTRRSLLKHPRAAPLILHHFPRHLLLDAYDRAAREDPLSRELHLAVIEGTEKITFGSALFEGYARSTGVPSFPPVDEAAYPTLNASLRANPFEDEELFVETLRVFLAGAKARADARAWGKRLAF
jgi:TetR/AcrR family tetracycline transcriptional repressor